MPGTALLWLVGGAVAVCWVALAQLRTRRVRLSPLVVVVVLRWILLAYGLALIALSIRSQRTATSPAVWGVLAAMAVLAVGLGVVRGAATTVWTENEGGVRRRGGVRVIALWVISFAAHLALSWLLDRISPGTGPTTMLAYLVAAIAAQNITVRRRAAG